ncbi:hypothetical protein LTS01_018254 [Friedmanniomyces endolithicus]|nr:hypothetical protein LTS01_018254 [Friedmanniomyces endolithicus]
MSKNASGSRKPFIEEVDEDSVASDTTQDSEQEDDNYGVDEILAEDRDSEDAGGGIRYLLKWTGYPLMRSTWEPAAHIHTDLVIKQWEEQKRRIRLGEVEAFNLEDWHAKKNRLGEEKLERVGRRKAKRRRRGLVVSSDEEYQDDGADGGRSPNRKRLPRLDSDDEEVIDAGQSVKRQRRVKAAPVKRKGIARKVSSVRKQVDTSSEDEAEAAVPNTQDSDLNSLFEEVSQPIYPDIELSTKPRPVPNSKAATPVRAPVRDPPTSAPKPSILHAQQGSRAENAVGTATRTKDQNVFAHFPDTDRKRRQRTRVSGETRKDSADPKFTKLSIQNRYQNYGKNEPAPDINALSMIDPKTGKIEAPKITSASAAIPDVYGRRRSPPRTGRQRSLTPPPPPPPPPPADHQLSGSDPTIGPSGRKRTKECWDWRYATCRATAETCNYAHYNVDRNDTLPKFVPENPSIDSQTAGDIANATGMQPPYYWTPPSGDWVSRKQTTRYYWLLKGCTKLEDECEFTHRFTGHFPNKALQNPDLMRRVTEMKNTACRDWAMGNMCSLPEDQCKYAHRYTGAGAGPPGIIEQRVAAPTTSWPGGSRPKKTCFFWKNTRCGKGEGCPYAHYDTGVVANPPPGFRFPDSEDASRLQYNPTSPLMESMIGAEPSMMIPFRAAEATTTPIIEAPQTMESTADRTVRFQLPQSEAPPAVIYNHRNSQITPATIEVRCGSAAAPDNVKVVAADLHVSGASMFERLFYPIRKGVYLMPDSMITAKDVQTYMAGLLQESAQWPAGSMVPAEASRLEADAVVECCKLHASGLVAMQDKYTLLLYPAYDDEWRFVERPDAPMVPNAPLRFLFMPPMKGRSVKRVTATPSPLQRAPVTAIVAKDILGIDARKLLIEKDGKPPDTSVFLAWPQEHDAELEILVKTFQELSCKVYHSGTPGAWQNFRRRYYKSCLILVHPDTPLWEIPRLHSILLNGGVRVFSIGLQRTASPSLYGCERLFPIGKVTFITDDVFVNHPEQASQIIQLFLDTNKAKPPGGENDKIAARPGVKDWLRHLATERTRDGNDKRWLRLYYDICQLCPPQDEDLYDLPNPSPTSHLVSLPPREMPSSVGLWERDPEAATDAMVEWFAGWSVLNASQYRKFLVCFESEKATMVMDENGQAMYRVVADPRGWAKSWQHIDVQRPEQLGKKLVGNGK